MPLRVQAALAVVVEIGKGVGKCWSDLEWTRVAEDLTDCLVVFRISISI